MDSPPPPPPPHGSRTSSGGGNKRSRGSRTGGLPDGKYDIFVIPPSSSGSGFLYLPSLQTHRNSFLAGCFCTAATFFVYSTAVPVIKEWFNQTINGGGSGVVTLVGCVALISWFVGKVSTEGIASNNGSSKPETASNGSTGPKSKRGSKFRAEEADFDDEDDDDDEQPRRPHPSSQPPPQPQSQPQGQPPPPQPTPGAPPHPPQGASQPPPTQEAPPPHSGSHPQSSPPKASWQKPDPDAKARADARSGWEKAREETRKREEERRRQDELKRRREELEKERVRQREKEARERLDRELKERRERELREAADRETTAKREKLERDEREIAAKKEKLERDEQEMAAKKQREKEKDEREHREKLEREEKDRKDKLEKDERERRERDIKEAVDRERKNREMAAKEKELRDKEETLRKETEKINAERIKAALAAAAAQKKPPTPTAKTEKEDDTYSFRPYDRQRARSAKTGSAGSVYSEDSYAPSATTAKTTPPGSDRGPYTTKDPEKIIIKAVYSFNNAFMRTPVAQLISGQGNVTDGLILRITTEGLFIDDDVRGVPQREWDVKAWTLKLAETCEISGKQVLRASIRDQEGKKYVFIIGQSESWKVALGLQRLRKGSQVRALGVAGMPMNEAKMILDNLGWA